jgi:transposase
MTLKQSNRDGRILVGIDVAKYEHVVAIEFPDGKTERLRIKNRKEDFEILHAKLNQQKEQVEIGLEPTCSFHRNISHFFMVRGFKVRGVSSLVGARTREALHNSWDKNDAKDSDVILYLLKQNMTQTLTEPAIAGHNHLQELSKTYEQIVRRKTKIQHSIVNHYLPIYFPEAHVFFTGSRTRWFSRVLKHFPVPSMVVKFSFDDFLERASVIVGKVPFKHSLIKDYYTLAQQSVGIPVGSESYEVRMFVYTVKELERLNQQLASLEKEVLFLMQDNLDFKILKSVPGIGPLIALTILAEAGDLRRFLHERQFLKYCGLNLSTEQSGVSKGYSRLAKRGNPRLRSVFWQAARVAINMKNENAIKQKYERYIESAPKDSNLRRKARSACAAKVARIVFSLIKNGKPFSLHLERTNLSGRTRGKTDVEETLTTTTS